jgi:type IV fimbrial biogenesis protein FimT
VLTKATQRGFTLIELLVGLAIFGILIVSALPSYTAWIQNTKIRNAAESVQNGLQLARSEAVMRNTNVQFVFGTNSGWSVSVVTPPEPLQTRAAEQGSAGVTIATTPTGTTLTFNSLGRVTANADSSASFGQVDFTVPPTTPSAALARPLRVTISPAGRVRMCDPGITDATDTRTCNL